MGGRIFQGPQIAVIGCSEWEAGYFKGTLKLHVQTGQGFLLVSMEHADHVVLADGGNVVKYFLKYVTYSLSFGLFYIV